MKRFSVQVLQDGEIQHIWKDVKVGSFRKTVNGGLGECVLEVDKEFNEELEGLGLGKSVKVVCGDKDANSIVIYSGYISRYFTEVKGKKEKFIVNLLGHYTKFAQDVWKNGTDTTHDYSGSATDTGEMMRDLLARYVAENDNDIIYHEGIVPDTSSTATYTFKRVTYQEGINIIKSLSPPGWFWYVGADDLFHFKEKPTSPAHTFYSGRDFKDIRIERSLEKVKNTVLFLAIDYDGGGSNVYRMYRDYFSVNQYGRRIKMVRNDEIGSEPDAKQIAEHYIDQHKDPAVKITATIIDNNYSDKGYDIESIEPGDTCDFRGFSESFSDSIRGNMLITEVRYNIDSAVITIEPLGGGIVERATRLDERVTRQEREGATANYDTP